jgi:hypothetical protein
MGYFAEKKVEWAAKQERVYSRTMKFASMSQGNLAIVTGGYLFVGFVIGFSVLFTQPFIVDHPLIFVGLMVGVLVGAILAVNFVIERAMKKAGV